MSTAVLKASEIEAITTQPSIVLYNINRITNIIYGVYVYFSCCFWSLNRYTSTCGRLRSFV